MSEGFERTLDHLRSLSDSEAQKGRLFERLMKKFFAADPLYKERFADVWLWSEWADRRSDFDGTDIGIDLVAAERDGGYCAIQCKFYSESARISKAQLDSFISASARKPFVSRIVVDSGAEWGPNAKRTINNLEPACAVLRFGDLADRSIDWPDLTSGEPEDLSLKGEPFSLRPHQQDALEAVAKGFGEGVRGNQRTQGERSRREGDNAFGQESRVPVAITLLVRKQKADQSGCKIYYHDIGDYLKRDEKLKTPVDSNSISGIGSGVEIAPGRHHDRVGQRSEEFSNFYALGSRDAKSGKIEDAIFGLYSNGYKSGRDAYTYNYSYQDCADNGREMVKNYQGALRELQQSTSAFQSVDGIVKHHSSNLRWDSELRDSLLRFKDVTFDEKKVRSVSYRPFVSINCYMDYDLACRKYRVDEMFPENDSDNLVICVPSAGSSRPFSTLMVNRVPDHHLLEFGQCFPRYRYSKANTRQGELVSGASNIERRDNITYTAHWNFARCYVDLSITKDDIFYYIYALLHAPSYRKRFAVDLTKEIPRVPMDPEFHALSRAGRALAGLHLGYETCDEFPLESVTSQPLIPQEERFNLSNRAMRFVDDSKTELRINDYLTLRGIPAEAHQYQVNGRTPLEWLIDRYKVAKDKDSGILNDPNDWFEHPEDLIAAIRRIVWVSVETTKIVNALPDISGSNYYDYRLVFDIDGEATRGAIAVANSPHAAEDQAFVDAITDTDWGEWDG